MSNSSEFSTEKDGKVEFRRRLKIKKSTAEFIEREAVRENRKPADQAAWMLDNFVVGSGTKVGQR